MYINLLADTFETLTYLHSSHAFIYKYNNALKTTFMQRSKLKW